MRSPNSSARSPFMRDSSGRGFIGWQNGHVLVINSFRNIQRSGPLVELRGGHTVVFQVVVMFRDPERGARSLSSMA